MRQSILMLLILLAGALCQSQVLPDALRVDWSTAGLQSPVPQVQQFRNVLNYGAVGDGVTDDRAAIVSALSGLNGQMTEVYFPPGIYRIGSGIQLPERVILKGASSDSTFIRFDFGGQALNGFSVFGQAASPFVPVSGGLHKGSDTLFINDSAGINIQPGDDLELQQDNGAWDVNPAFWAATSVGQIVRAVAVNGNAIAIDQELRISYDPTLNPSVRKLNAKEFVGIECLHLERIDNVASGVSYNVQFNHATNCWVSGVESSRSVGSHIMISASSHIGVSGSYIHHAFDYNGAGTRGYGVTLAQHAGQCLIENNVFRYLRHAMMVKEGANGNVFAYNYSREPNRSELISDFSGDISLHGHYAFANLFEGNVVQNIIIDHYWGPSGPWNTFLRNRVELYGLIVTGAANQTVNQNFIGNELTGFGFYTPGNSSHIEFANNISDSIFPTGTDTTFPSSFFLGAAPSFWDTISPWPFIGYPIPASQHRNPALDRYLTNQELTICCPPAGCTHECPAPVDPASVYAGSTSVRLEWDILQPVQGFELRGRAIGQSLWIYVPFTCGSCKHLVVNNLDPSVTYEWQIRSVCDSAESSWSATDTFQLINLANCAAPVLKPVDNITASGATLRWHPVPGAHSYAIAGRVQGSSSIVLLTVSMSDTMLMVNNLQPNTTYEYAVRAQCGANGTAQSNFSIIDVFATNAMIQNAAKSLPPHEPFEVYDLSGRLRFRSNAESDWQTAEGLEGLPSGVYVLRYPRYPWKSRKIYRFR